MKDQLDVAKETLGRVAALFLVLWFISAVTDLMGKYEFEVQFLQLAVGFFLLSQIPTSLRRHYSAGKKVQEFFTNLGWPLVGLWILFTFFRWVGWFGAMEIGIDIKYLLAAGILLLLIGYSAKSARSKSAYWAARSIFFSLGGVSILFWILIKIFHIFNQYQDLVLVAALVAFGVGFILGGLRRPPSFFVEIEEEEKKEPEVKEEVYVTEESTISRDRTRVKINKGSLLVPVFREKEIGGIYFGEGSYQVNANVKVYSGVYRGITVVSGDEWDSVKPLELRPADEKDFEAIGLKKEEVLELARLQVKGKLTDELKRKLKQTQIDLPFFKLRETHEGSYVRVGPIEVKETPGGDHVRLGPWKVSEYESGHRFTREGLFIEIRTKDEDITIKTNGKTVMIKGDTRITVNDGVTMRSEDMDLVMSEDKKMLRSGKIKLICRKDRRILHSNGFELSIGENSGRIRKNGKSIVIEDKNKLEEIRTELDAVADELIKEVLDRGELRELDTLIKRFEQEL